MATACVSSPLSACDGGGTVSLLVSGDMQTSGEHQNGGRQQKALEKIMPAASSASVDGGQAATAAGSARKSYPRSA